MYGQNGVDFVLTKHINIKDSAIWIKATITNNNDRKLYILDGSMLDNEGNSDGGDSYIKYNSYSSNGKLLRVSRYIYLGRPGASKKRVIILKQGESYQLTYSLYNYFAWLGIFGNPSGTLPVSLDATLHLVYFWETASPVFLTTDIVSNKLVL